MRWYIGYGIVGMFWIMGLSNGYAVDSIQVVGLSKDKAVVKLDNKQRVLKIGKPTPEGVILISVSDQGAELEIEGQRQFYQLDTRVSTHYQAESSLEARVFRNEAGMYRSVGSINGLTVNFLVDTGATMVSVNAKEAKRLGIEFRVDGKPAQANTAAGVVPAYVVKLKSVKVGDIELTDIDGMVIEGDYPQEVLLGNSFLGRLQLERQQNQMILRKTY